MAARKRPALDPPPGFVHVGVVAGLHGPSGALRILSDSDNPDRYAQGGELSIGGQTYRIAAAAPFKAAYLIRLDGVDDADAAALAGEPVLAAADTAPPLPEGVYYHYQLIGLAVTDADGAPLGVLTEVLRTGANDVYVVASENAELLVPAIADVVRGVDLERGVMTVVPPDGLEPRPLGGPSKRKTRPRQGGATRAAKR
ncbi:MAG: 16S rRNA processing protein RimM [Dehalococcoidia bacterium]|nr:16S rRNA processing protein RimM [Dehalococcoidia bacterium]